MGLNTINFVLQKSMENNKGPSRIIYLPFLKIDLKSLENDSLATVFAFAADFEELKSSDFKRFF